MKVCIEQTPEGFLVYQDEPEGMEAMEGQESYGEPVASVDEALEAARALLGGDTTTDEPQMEGEAEFTQAFQQARGGY